MEKLLTLISKLKNEIVPESPVGKMPKEALLAFIRDANLLDRMRTFHQKEIKGVRSVITDDEAPLVPSEGDITDDSIRDKSRNCKAKVVGKRSRYGMFRHVRPRPH